MKFTAEQIKEILHGDHPDFEVLEEENNGADGRWYVGVRVILEHCSGKYYEINYRRAATEYQESEYDACELVEVERVEKVIQCWEPVKCNVHDGVRVG